MEPVVIDETFLKGLPYMPEGFFIDRVLEADPTKRQITCEVDTTKPFPLVREQKHHEVLHPPHLPGAVIIHLTGMVGLAAAQVFLGIRFDQGWSGYGSRIHRGDFKRIVKLGPPLRLECTITDVRKRQKMVIVRYALHFYQEKLLAYKGDQTAVYRCLDSGLTKE